MLEVVVFDHDQPGYNAWSESHREGYVAALCTHRPAQPGHCGMHRANCWTIRQNRPGFDYTVSPKICGDRRVDVEAWLLLNGYGPSLTCHTCL